jgi:DNA-binding GntR family transcriptional regulator
MMDDQLIWPQARAAEIVCKRMSSPELNALHESLQEACQLSADAGWDRKAAAHAAFFTVLAEAADDPVVAPVLLSGSELAYDLMIKAGRMSDGIVINSRRRFLEFLRAGDAEGAALELAEHLRILHFMCRLYGRFRVARRDGQSFQADRVLTDSKES